MSFTDYGLMFIGRMRYGSPSSKPKKEKPMPSENTVYHQGRTILVPKKGMKIVHRQLGCRGMVLMVTNLKYQNPQTIQVVFEGADNEIYSRPLSDFWDHWKQREVQYVVYTEDTRPGWLYMRRYNGKISWTRVYEEATGLSADEADARIQLLRDAGAVGNYQKRQLT